MERVRNIVIIGGGSIGTAMGNSLASREDLKVKLLTIEEEVARTISTEHINQKYFPNIRLNPNLEAVTDERTVAEADLIFLAIPSVAVYEYLLRIQPWLQDKAILINLAKGFSNEKRLISDCIRDNFPNPVCALKGPSFAREIINNIPTALTLSAEDPVIIHKVATVFERTNIHIDQSLDLKGVEFLSILKNIYAILIGIVDAQYNSPNIRFLVFTKAFNEMRQILLHFGGKEETMFNYCGIGDFGLTALNDLSRNRTLGLLIGKGFFTEDISGKVVLEGRIAMNVILEKLTDDKVDPSNFILMRELERVFDGKNGISGFVNRIL